MQCAPCAVAQCRLPAEKGLVCKLHEGEKITLVEVRRTASGGKAGLEDPLGIRKKTLEKSCRRFWLFVGWRRGFGSALAWPARPADKFRH